MKIDEISFLGLLAPIWLALGLQFVLFLQPGIHLPVCCVSPSLICNPVYVELCFVEL